MKRLAPIQLCTLLALTAAGNWGHAAETVAEAVSNGTTKLSLRMRYEDVDIPSGNNDLLSLKSRITFTTESFSGFTALLEMDDVTHVTDLDSGAGIPGIGDPEGTEINQSSLTYTFGESALEYGRQRILLDNQRFVGGVGFRQNEQTYDASSIDSKSIDDLEIFLGYVFNVNRIFGENSPVGDHNNETTLFNAKYTGLSAGAISAYAYIIDNLDALAFSSDTMGLRFAGSSGDFSYAVEYATQSDGGDSPLSYDADYTMAEGGIKLGSVNLALGYEVLGADGTNGQFITPLATLHAFQGWADVFLGGGTGNVPGGIEDMYFKLSTKLAGLNLLVKYHQFAADDSDVAGTSDYGSEIGFSIAKSWDNYGLSLKYADYSEDGFAVDTEKLWLTFTANF